MRNILCYGDSNTWGYMPGSMDQKLMLAKRLDYNIRWTGVLQDLLGENYHIIEAGLNGRTTCFEELEIIRPSRNGLATLPGILEMHYPVDLVIFMLGTNDVKTQFDANPDRISRGMQQLIQYVKKSRLGSKFLAPEVLVIAPAPIFKIDLPTFNLFFDEASIAKFHKLAKYYELLAKDEKCAFLDAGPLVKISPSDGIHIEAESHKNLARAITKEILSRWF